MPYVIGIDTGGTFTDGYLWGEGKSIWVKSDTTPHDLTVGFNRCLEALAEKLGATLPETLRQTQMIRLSTTLATNTLINRSGLKVGLIVTKGYEKNLYTGETSSLYDFALSPERVTGIAEEMDIKGHSLKEPDPKEVKQAVKQLLDSGARMIVVSLKNAWCNPVHEKLIKTIVTEDYPEHYLGAIPLLLATEVTMAREDALRTNTAVLNAYLHDELARYLYKAEDGTREKGYLRPLLIARSDGGVSRVAKTTAINTWGSGPACGLAGAAAAARLYKLDKVVTLDVGGTSSDAALLLDANYATNPTPTLEGVPVRLTVSELSSVGGGGGSLVSVSKGDLKVGPESAGAIPGPVCYGLGGEKPTVTDAWVVLGYIDPDYFLGGRRRLDPGRARAVLEEEVAKPLGLSTIEAAFKIFQEAGQGGARALQNILANARLKADECTLFAFGGGGGLLGPAIAEQLGLSRVYFFPFGAVFSAFGACTLDIAHHYEALANLSLSEEAFPRFNQLVKELQETSLRDMRGEGFSPEKISFALKLTLTGPQGEKQIGVPWLLLERKEQITELGGYEKVIYLHLAATVPVEHPQMSYQEAIQGQKAEQVLKGQREVYWPGGWQKTPVYEQSRLKQGDGISGPALIEGEDTVILIPEGYSLKVDLYGNAILQKS